MGGTIVLGIGNRLGGDDAAGTCVVDAGTAPESYTSVIRQHRPDLLILVDAADMGLSPGALRTIAPEKISVVSFSTHHMPLSMFIAYVKEFCGKVLLVGVQPERTEMGSGISKAVRNSVTKVAKAIREGRIAEISLLG
jgi:hydrogenase 3 maturation protease